MVLRLMWKTSTASQLDRLDHFATQVIAIRLGHGRDGKGATFLVHVLMQMATAIQELQRTEQEWQWAEKFAAQLRALGINPDEGE
jgi:hypothetical protein